jgi:hypothetical protein
MLPLLLKQCGALQERTLVEQVACSALSLALLD